MWAVVEGFGQLGDWVVLVTRLCARSRSLYSQAGASPQTNQRQLEAQEPLRTAQASRVDRAPKMDGTLDDPLWQQAAPFTNFLQREPHAGTVPTEPAGVRVLYTKRAIYFGLPWISY